MSVFGRPQIRLHSYLANNLGDDLFVRIICRRYPDVTFWVACSRDRLRAFGDLPNLKRIPTIRGVDRVLRIARVPFRVNDAIRARIEGLCDAVVHLGGSMFMEQGDWRERVAFFTGSILPSKPCFVIGAHFGPFSDPGFPLKIAQFFAEIEDVCFRDSYSSALFRESPNVRYAPDVVFGYSPLRHNPEPPTSRVAISVIDLTNRSELVAYKDLYLEKLSDLVNMLVSRGLDVVLMSFCGPEGDGSAVKELLERFPSESIGTKVQVYHYEGDLDGALLELSRCSVVVSSRLHAMILAMVMGKPVIPVTYSNKTINVLKDMGYAAPWFKIDALGELDPTAVAEWIMTAAPCDMNVWRVRAGQQFEALDRLLASGDTAHRYPRLRRHTSLGR